MFVLIVGLSAVFGLLIGSFLNVVIARLPQGESIVHPRSRCPACKTEIAPRDNIPVLSWLLLRGRCRTCDTRISPRYPVVELVTGVLFGAMAARFGADWALPAFLVLSAAVVALSAIDLDTFTLPRQIIYVAGAISVVLLVAAGLVADDTKGITEAAAGAAIGFGVLLVIHLISPRGMGFGDVRLAALLGLFLGWIELPVVAVGLFLAFLLASVVGVGLMIAGRRGRKDRLPFGPFLAAGAVLAIFVGPQILDLYLGR